MQSGEFLGRFLDSLLKIRLPLMRNELPPLAKSILMPLLLTAAAAGARIHKKIWGPGATTIIISNKEMKDIIKLVKSVEGFCLLIKCVGKAIQNEAKE